MNTNHKLPKRRIRIKSQWRRSIILSIFESSGVYVEMNKQLEREMMGCYCSDSMIKKMCSDLPERLTETVINISTEKNIVAMVDHEGLAISIGNENKLALSKFQYSQPM